jgi:hypothetical protein
LGDANSNAVRRSSQGGRHREFFTGRSRDQGDSFNAIHTAIRLKPDPTYVYVYKWSNQALTLRKYALCDLTDLPVNLGIVNSAIPDLPVNLERSDLCDLLDLPVIIVLPVISPSQTSP